MRTPTDEEKTPHLCKWHSREMAWHVRSWAGIRTRQIFGSWSSTHWHHVDPHTIAWMSELSLISIFNINSKGYCLSFANANLEEQLHPPRSFSLGNASQDSLWRVFKTDSKFTRSWVQMNRKQLFSTLAGLAKWINSKTLVFLSSVLCIVQTSHISS